MVDNKSKAEAIMNFVDSMVGAFDAGYVDRNHCTLSEIHTVAKHHVKDTYGVDQPNAVEKYGEKMAKDIGLNSPRPENYPHARTCRRVVCAAIRSSDGDVLIGIRHYSKDMHQQIKARHDGKKFLRRHDPDQGFVDQYGVYMTREEAFEVAKAANQVIFVEHCGKGLDGMKLYSEGLY